MTTNLPLFMDDLLAAQKLTWEQMETMRLLKGTPGTYYQQASDREKTTMRDWVRSLAQKQEITVTFVKADGSVRDMRCTLNRDLIPESSQPRVPTTIDGLPGPGAKKGNEHTMAVFDLDAGAWRSFRFDRLKKVHIVLAFAK